MITLSKEFFSVIKKAIYATPWQRAEFPMVESVEKELKLLFDSQNSQVPTPYNSSNDPYQEPQPIFPPIKYTPAPKPIVPTPPLSATDELSTQSTAYPQKKKAPVKKKSVKSAEVPKNGNPDGMSASPDGMAAIDSMIMSGIEMAKVAPRREAALLRNVVVEQLPETPEDDDLPMLM